ncbi:MAG TPA: CAP domain-containing protein [Planctomycetota bacterium]|nr:CAP domain-containing protein [Planctomycetota bacterium]
MSPLLLAALALLPAQTEDFQKRVRIEGGRVLADDQVLYEGPWKKAEVTVVDVGGKKARVLFGDHDPWRQVVVTVDGEERVRLPVRTLEKPVAWPPTRLEEVQPVLKRLTETIGTSKTFICLLSTAKGDVEIYRGPEYETRAERTSTSFTVFLNGEVLYRISRGEKPPARVEDVVMAINLKRVKVGLGVVRPVPGLSRGCDLHALYLTKNDAKGLSAHEEDPRGVGYTDDGAKAGKRSVISPFPPHESPVEAVESLMATLYHRVALLNPAVAEVGVGWAYRKDGLGFLVVDVGGSAEGRPDPKLYPIVYPVNGQEEVPLDFGLGARENPNPLPEDRDAAGYPVTLQIPERTGRGCDADLRLFTGETEVACWLSTPDAPARKDWPQPGVLCLIPRERLKAGTLYTVRFRDRLSGLDKEWSFSTRR